MFFFSSIILTDLTSFFTGEGKQNYPIMTPPELSSPHSGALLTTALPHPIKSHFKDEKPIKKQTSAKDNPSKIKDNLNGSLPKDDAEISSNSSHESLSPKTDL